MKKTPSKISGPEELNKHLQSTSVFTWIVLGVISAMLIAFFAWGSIYKLKIRVSGDAHIDDAGVATLTVSENDLTKLKVGQTVYINDKQGEITSFAEDNTPVVSKFELSEGDYKYYVVVEEKKLISFVFGN